MGATARGRRLILALTALVMAALTAGLVTAAVWRHDASRQRYAVAMPPAAATARQVVLAYLHALDAHDVATAEALSTAGFRGETRSWLESTAHMRQIAVENVTHYPRQHEYDVNVSFRYSSHWWKRDSSFPDGDEYWGYTLIPWHGRLLISMDGTG